MKIHLHQGDLPGKVLKGSSVAIDTEAMGLKPIRDRLCLVQLSDGEGDVHIVQFPAHQPYHAPHLKSLLADASIVKIFHFARFDVALLFQYLGVLSAPLYCTKIASRLARTQTNRHSLKDLCKDILDVELPKEEQMSDWGSPLLSQKQLSYAAADVLYLHQLKQKLDQLLIREGRQDLAEACFRFLPYRAQLDLLGWEEEDIFQHH